jgi:hypothetical protein
MNKILEVALGLSPAALIRGLRHGPRDLARSARRGFTSTGPFERYFGEIGSVGLPEQPLDLILGARKSSIRLNVMAYEDGMLPIRDALPLISLAVAENPRAIVEIGTFMGHTARALAENVPGATVHTIDLPPDFAPTDDTANSGIPKDDFHLIAKRRVGREFRGTEFESRIVQHFGDTAQLDFKQVGRASFFFIDGSHTYEYCKNDSEKCLEIAEPGSVFLWHDCDANHPGVVQFCHEWRRQGRDIVLIAGTALAYWKSPA